MIGDIYFKSAEQDKAGEWFARAIDINPDRENGLSLLGRLAHEAGSRQ
jgi:hypothetical protein